MQHVFVIARRAPSQVGWTLSPGLAFVAPSALAHVAASRTANDELVAGPSGVGYIFPTTWPDGNVIRYHV